MTTCCLCDKPVFIVTNASVDGLSIPLCVGCAYHWVAIKTRPVPSNRAGRFTASHVVKIRREVAMANNKTRVCQNWANEFSCHPEHIRQIALGYSYKWVNFDGVKWHPVRGAHPQPHDVGLDVQSQTRWGRL